MKRFLLALACLVLPAQTQDPVTDPPEKAALENAYRLLREKKYLEAIEELRRAAETAPRRTDVRKELGYAYLKAGETDAARDVFEQALELDPTDLRVALELAFLSHETGREARSLELLDRVRRSGDGESRKTAEEAFARVDQALRTAIERWSAAVAQDPANRAARLELAQNLEKHRQPAQAAGHYLAAWRLPPRREETLLELARARQDAGDVEGAAGAWLLASRSRETRIAERARSRLARRDPYASEFRHALELDPSHTGLRRDLAFLWLSAGSRDEAVAELQTVVAQDPNDLVAAAQLGFLHLERNERERAAPLLEKAMRGPDTELARRAGLALGKEPPARPLAVESRPQPTAAASVSASLAQPHKEMGEKSMALSYLADALREFRRAHELDPGDREVALKLGLVHNLLKQDREALPWFRLAMDSPNPAVASQARRGYRNLAPSFQRFQTTLWVLPFYSTRYRDAFQYSQLKTELRVGRSPIRPYLSLRLVGDWKRRTAEPMPQFLSESSMILGVGARTAVWRGFLLWGEAGEAVSYLRRPPAGVPRMGPDYRGGVAWARHLGASLGAESSGPFAELSVDGVFLSRFQNNFITYWQLRPGYRLPVSLRSQVFWNTQVTFDRRLEYYANFVEFGPGFRFRFPRLSPPLDVSVSALRGVYLVNRFNPRRPNYLDLRVGLWYAITR